MPSAFGIGAFLAGCWLSVSLGAAPLWALLGPEVEILDAVNQVREVRHLRTLRPDEELARVARAHAKDMASHDYLDHIDKQGQNPLQRVQAAGVTGFHLLAENIGSTDEDGSRTQILIKAWLASPVHRENLLNPAFNASGIGTASRPDGTSIVVELFATY